MSRRKFTPRQMSSGHVSSQCLLAHLVCCCMLLSSQRISIKLCNSSTMMAFSIWSCDRYFCRFLPFCVFSICKLFYYSRLGGTGVSGLTRDLATLPTVDPGAFSGQRQGWTTPRGPPCSALLLCV